MRSQSPARRVFLAAAAIAAISMSSTACGLDLLAQEEARSRWSQTYPVTRGVTLDIRNTNGRIVVEPTDGDSIEVEAERVARAGTEERAREALEGIQIEATVTASRIQLQSKTSTLGLSVNRTVHYRVRVPRWTNVELTATNGEVRVEGLEGEVRIDATNGRIDVRDLRNGAAIATTNGAISIDVAHLGTQGIECETTNGAITLTLPQDADADVSARVRNGAIATGNLELSVSEDSRRRLEGRLGEGGTRVRLETTNGAIRLRAR